MKIAVYGLGTIGKPLAAVLEARDHVVARVDPALGMNDKVDKVDMTFVCVPTPVGVAASSSTASWPSGSRFDPSALHEALCAAPKGVPTVIRSTVFPGTTETFQAALRDTPLLYCPEFLTAANALGDELHPARVVVGYTEQSEKHAPLVHEVLAQAPLFATVPAPVAELLKLATNGFYALKIAWANQLHDVARELDVDYVTLRDCLAADPFIAAQHLNVHQDGYRGFDVGLEKDAQVYAELAAILCQAKPNLVMKAIKYNTWLLEQGKEDDSDQG